MKRTTQAAVLGLFSFIPIILGWLGVRILAEYLVAITSPLRVYGALCFILAWVILSVVFWYYLREDVE